MLTGKNGSDATPLFNHPGLLSDYFCSAYLYYSQTSNWVVEADAVMGYLVCALDTRDYNAWLENDWLPALRQRYAQQLTCNSQFESFLLELIHQRPPLPTWVDDYPAHLHIDLLPEVQGQGYGRLLINTLLESLREQAVSGVHLGVGKANPKAIMFYKAMGFELIEEDQYALLLGQRC
ncbi:GNAT family N-acetyltransferase [Aliagarivorans taiwanensis]|uniref:GNAT family N-acetyltransferase n=1 Tax=Aliagarivorans taiwanensis TaxID=561966 RepID=UPI00041CEBD7|nr:GNAT family N-acetyltransferase [Aliagarivorans taiwanensis]